MDELTYEQEYEYKEAVRRLRRFPLIFGKKMFPGAFKKDSPPHHAKIMQALVDRAVRRVLIAAPRGTAKSTVASLLYPLYRVAFKQQDEELFIVIISESGKQARNFLGRIKYHLDNADEFRLFFGDYSKNTALRWREDDIKLKDGTRIVALGTGQSIRGYIEGDTRPNIVVVDDFESENNALTPEARAKNRKWLTEAVMPSLADEAKIIVIGTVISEDCFLFHAKDSGTWDVQWYEILKEDGTSLWPDKFPLERIENIKKEFQSVDNLRGFYQEYMNQPQPPEEAPFKPRYMREHHYQWERIEGQNCLVKEVRNDDGDMSRTVVPIDIYCGVDTASSLSIRADYFVIAMIGVDYHGKKYVIDIERGRVDPALQPQMIIDKYTKFRPLKVKIETIAYQEALRSNVRKLMFEQDLYIPGIENGVKPRNSKSERLLSLVPVLARGDFYFRPQDVTAQQEFLSYPTGKHDDIMDAIWLAVEHSKPCGVKTVEDEKESKKPRAKKKINWKVGF